jgi:anti-sigma factor RsiW
MTCADARNIILSADPGALRDRTDPVLREHLERCPACAVAAAHVVDDVARLRAALIARGSRAVRRPRRSPARRAAMTLIPVALAAELAAFAFLGARDNPNPLTDRRPVIDDTVVSMVPEAHRVDSGEVAIAPKRAHAKAAKHVVTAKDSAAEPIDTATRAAVPSEFMSSEEMGQLRVTPTNSRQRVAVLGTSNPRITVVLVSRVDSI